MFLLEKNIWGGQEITNRGEGKVVFFCFQFVFSVKVFILISVIEIRLYVSLLILINEYLFKLNEISLLVLLRVYLILFMALLSPFFLVMIWVASRFWLVNGMCIEMYVNNIVKDMEKEDVYLKWNEGVGDLQNWRKRESDEANKISD